jgi:hypothetical protein
MIRAAHYLLAEHSRSRSFVAPLLLLGGGVVVLYAQPPNPVLSTAGTVAAFLFPVQCWLALAFLDSQSAPDRHILAATVGGRRFACSRLLALAVLAVASSLFALLVPLLGGLFKRTPRPDEIALILAANLIATVAASALAIPFSAPIVKSRAIAVLGLTTVIVLSIPLRLPPMIPTARALNTGHAARVPGRIATDFLIVLAFTLASATIGAWQWRRRE